MGNFDLTGINNAITNSARQMTEIESAMNYINTAKIEREAKEYNAILQTAEFTGQQKELLEKQLEEVKQQNVKLEEANKSLNALYEQAKKDAEENAKVAEKSKLQAKISIGISIFAVVVSIVMGILGIVL